jgi:hypothetical protein
MHFFILILFEIYCKELVYDMLKQKEHMLEKNIKKHLTQKKVWTLEWLKMNHILISQYHNHFWVDFNFYFLNMYINFFKKDTIIHMGFLVH